SREATAAGARKEAAVARARQASGFRLPSLTFTEMYVRTDAPAESFAFKMNKEQFSFPEFVSSDPNDPGWSGTAVTRLEAVWPLFTGGELSTRIKQAERVAEAAEQSAAHTSDRVAVEAAQAYVMVAQAEEYERLLTRARETVEAHVDLAEAYVGQGMLVRSELLRAQVELARVDDLLEEARGRVRVANANLAFRLGEVQSASWQLSALPPPRPLEGDVAAWVATAGARNDLAAARSLLSAGEMEEKAKKANLFPKLAVVAPRRSPPARRPAPAARKSPGSRRGSPWRSARPSRRPRPPAPATPRRRRRSRPPARPSGSRRSASPRASSRRSTSSTPPPPAARPRPASSSPAPTPTPPR
ncbi:MAG: TolC family protein, partial [Acidobacteria bacterium ACB2]|nr:TolC family protein [Acidobacteria bacterium ACB2]